MRFSDTLTSATEEIRKEVLSLIPDDVITGSRALYIGYLQWLAPSWIFLDMQIEASPIHEILNPPEEAGLRADLLSQDYAVITETVEGGWRRQAPSVHHAFRGFREIPSAEEATGIFLALLSLERDSREIGRRLRRLGIKRRAGGSFYSGSARKRRKLREKLLLELDREFSEAQRAEIIDTAKRTFQALLIHFTSFREFAKQQQKPIAA